MKRPWGAFACILLGMAGCGGVTDVRDHAAGGADAGQVTAGSGGGEPQDAGTEDATTDGDGGWDLLPCDETNDCYGAATCQQGYCCSGTYENGHCTCGGVEPGCDLFHQCCEPISQGPDAGFQCVKFDIADFECYPRPP